MNTMTDTAKLSAAFDLVCPARRAAKLAEAGIISAADAATASWKDEIAELVTQVELEIAGVTISDVCAAVTHYTATEAMVRPCKVGGSSLVTWLGSTDGFFVQAAGYRRGPAW